MQKSWKFNRTPGPCVDLILDKRFKMYMNLNPSSIKVYMYVTYDWKFKYVFR